MGADTEGSQWSLYWTARNRPVPSRAVPLLAGWADLDERESAADIGPGHPVLIDPDYRLDPLLARFLSRSRFTWLADGTKQAYAKDYRLFFSFLWQRGKYWHEADPDDLLDWEAWRRRGQQPGRRISGSKWQRELAALRLVYEWAEKKDHIVRSPVLVHEVRLRDGGGTVMVADQAPRDVRGSDVKWVTPRTYRLWRDSGLLGYDVGGQPDLSWQGRNDGRNAAFTDLLFSSGLRLREGGCLLTLEVPDAAAGHRYYEGRVAGAVAKRRERMFYASAAALRRVAGYIATTRAEAVRRARRHRRYDQIPGKLIVTRASRGARPKVCWRDDRGRVGEARIGALSPEERMRLFTETEHGLEPLWLWLTESGRPMAYESWEKVFDAANARVAAVFAAATRKDGRSRTAIACSPHMMRTVAWHIARQPGGTIAVAIQYGHLRTLTSEGYSGRARHGLARVLDIETAAATASYLSHASERLDAGEGVSGPAAHQLASAARDASARFEGMFLSPRQARALLTDPALQVHDNPRAFLACNYDPAKALCHPGRTAGETVSHPDLDRCNPACANIARTDEHITALTAETGRPRAEAASPLAPEPIRQRLAQRADELERIAERHARTRSTAKDSAHG